MRVLVCGGRFFSDGLLLDRVLSEIEPSVVIHGAARGADMLAHNWAKMRGLDVEVYPAQWTKYGRSAGMIRNQQMLAKSRPELVVAFPGGKGTTNMIGLANKAGIKVREIV